MINFRAHFAICLRNYSNSVWPLPNIEFGRPIRLVRHKNIWCFFDTYSLLFLLLFWLECCSFLRSKHIKPKFFIHKKVSFEKKSFTKSQILFHNKKPPQNFIRRTLYILDRTKKKKISLAIFSYITEMSSKQCKQSFSIQGLFQTELKPWNLSCIHCHPQSKISFGNSAISVFFKMCI